jgi:hypothetical protein
MAKCSEFSWMVFTAFDEQTQIHTPPKRSLHHVGFVPLFDEESNEDHFGNN